MADLMWISYVWNFGPSILIKSPRNVFSFGFFSDLHSFMPISNNLLMKVDLWYEIWIQNVVFSQVGSCAARAKWVHNLAPACTVHKMCARELHDGARTIMKQCLNFCSTQIWETTPDKVIFQRGHPSKSCIINFTKMTKSEDSHSAKQILFFYIKTFGFRTNTKAKGWNA